MASKFGANSSSAAITTFQQAYNNGSEPECKVNSTRGALSIQDADSTISASILDVIKSNASAYILRAQSDGRIHLPSIHNNGGTHNTIAEVASGTFSPTLTHIANVTSSFASGFKYSRTGNIVTCSGSITITPTLGADTTTTIAFSLPIASNFSSASDAEGIGVASSNVTQAPRPSSFIADAANDRVEMSFNSLLNTSVTYKTVFQYEVL